MRHNQVRNTRTVEPTGGAQESFFLNQACDASECSYGIEAEPVDYSDLESTKKFLQYRCPSPDFSDCLLHTGEAKKVKNTPESYYNYLKGQRNLSIFQRIQKLKKKAKSCQSADAKELLQVLQGSNLSDPQSFLAPDLPLDKGLSLTELRPLVSQTQSSKTPFKVRVYNYYPIQGPGLSRSMDLRKAIQYFRFGHSSIELIAPDERSLLYVSPYHEDSRTWDRNAFNDFAGSDDAPNTKVDFYEFYVDRIHADSLIQGWENGPFSAFGSKKRDTSTKEEARKIIKAIEDIKNSDPLLSMGKMDDAIKLDIQKNLEEIAQHRELPKFEAEVNRYLNEWGVDPGNLDKNKLFELREMFLSYRIAYIEEFPVENRAEVTQQLNEVLDKLAKDLRVEPHITASRYLDTMLAVDDPAERAKLYAGNVDLDVWEAQKAKILENLKAQNMAVRQMQPDDFSRLKKQIDTYFELRQKMMKGPRIYGEAFRVKEVAEASSYINCVDIATACMRTVLGEDFYRAWVNRTPSKFIEETKKRVKALEDINPIPTDADNTNQPATSSVSKSGLDPDLKDPAGGGADDLADPGEPTLTNEATKDKAATVVEDSQDKRPADVGDELKGAEASDSKKPAALSDSNSTDLKKTQDALASVDRPAIKNSAEADRPAAKADFQGSPKKKWNRQLIAGGVLAGLGALTLTTVGIIYHKDILPALGVNRQGEQESIKLAQADQCAVEIAAEIMSLQYENSIYDSMFRQLLYASE